MRSPRPRRRAACSRFEEHNRTNGLGTATAEALFEAGFGGVRLRRLDVPDEHVPIGPPAALYAHYHLDADGIADDPARSSATDDLGLMEAAKG